MKSPAVFFLFLFLFSFGKTVAQIQFEKIENEPIVMQPSDSRSINFVDVDEDGWEDIFISNGPSGGAPHLLYLNDGAGNFTAVTEGDIVETPGPFDGGAFADADNDGHLDLFVVTWYGSKNNLYRGNGDGTFAYLSDAAPSLPGTYSETAAWGDYDGDGLLDLYLSNSEDSADPNILYHNMGNFEFERILTGPPATDSRRSRSVNWVDYDLDCDLDLFVSNEANQPDDLYQNLGDPAGGGASGTFEKVTFGAPSQGNHSTISSSWGDIDNDGDLDIAVVNNLFSGPQANQLFRNDGDGTFSFVADGDFGTDGGCSNGSSFGDYDNDGDLDLVVANGFCSGAIVNFLYKNDGTGTFTRDLESIADLGTPCSYGTAWGDINNDGFLDLGVATCKNSTGSPLPENIFYRNLGNDNNYLNIKPIGTMTNRSAIGTKVWVTAVIGGEEVTQMREISSQTGYCGQNSILAHFGLGDATEASEVRIQFSCDSDTMLNNVAAGQTLTVTEDMATSSHEVLRSENLRLNVSPNPTSDTFLVEIFSEKITHEAKLEIYSSTGKMVWQKEVEMNRGESQHFSLSAKKMGLTSGVYFLKMGGEKVGVVVE